MCLIFSFGPSPPLIANRDVINTLTYSPYTGGPITMDHENTVKAYAASPSMLGRGHSLHEPVGPVWDVGASEWHSQLAVGGADGGCWSTNTLRSPRRGGSVVSAFLLCIGRVARKTVGFGG